MTNITTKPKGQPIPYNVAPIYYELPRLEWGETNNGRLYLGRDPRWPQLTLFEIGRWDAKEPWSITVHIGGPDPDITFKNLTDATQHAAKLYAQWIDAVGGQR